MGILLNILVFVFVMGVIVIVHEMGHLIAAKSFGVYCKEFAVGMGPKIYEYQSKKSETTYSVRALPIGGFVAMAGEPGEMGMEDVPLERTINGIAPWKRLIVMLAGVFMNLVLAFIVFGSIFGVNGVIREPEPIVQNVVEGYPAKEAGLLAGDRIVEMKFYDGTVVKPKTFTDASIAIMTFEDNPIKVDVLRDDKILSFTVTPIYNEDSDTFVMGIQSVSGALEKAGFIETIRFTGSYIIKMVTQILMILKLLVRGIGVDNVGGPIAIYQETSKVMESGFNALYLFNIIGSLSVSLAVMNLIPIPVFDGGRALLTVIEMIIRRPIPEKLENFVMLLGFAMALLIMIFFVFKDIKRF